MEREIIDRQEKQNYIEEGKKFPSRKQESFSRNLRIRQEFTEKEPKVVKCNEKSDCEIENFGENFLNFPPTLSRQNSKEIYWGI